MASFRAAYPPQSALGGQPIPAHRLGIILRYALPRGVHEPEFALGVGTALVGGQT